MGQFPGLKRKVINFSDSRRAGGSRCVDGYRLATVAGPVGIEVDDRDYHHAPAGGGEYDAYLLSVVGAAFEGIFWIGTGGGFTFPFVDAAGLEDLLHFAFVDMAAGHAAAGMFAIDELSIAMAAVEPAIAVGFIAGRFGWLRVPAIVGAGWLGAVLFGLPTVVGLLLPGILPVLVS